MGRITKINLNDDHKIDFEKSSEKKEWAETVPVGNRFENSALFSKEKDTKTVPYGHKGFFMIH